MAGVIPYQQLVEAISRWKAGGEGGADISPEPTNGRPAGDLAPDEVMEAEAMVTEEATEVVEPDPE